jgi:hypothetical protein
MTQTEPIYNERGEEIDPEDTPAIQAAREAANRGNARGDSAERKLAILQALPPVENTDLRDMFLKSYDGDIDEPDKIIAAAQAIGLVAPPEPEPTVDATAAVDAAAQAARSDLGTGALAPTEEPDIELTADPRGLGLEKFREAKKAGATDKNASAQFFDRVASAASRGDERVIWRGWTDEQLAGAVDV